MDDSVSTYATSSHTFVREEYSYVYAGDKLIKMVVKTTKSSGTTTDTLTFSYDANGSPLTVTYNGTTYYYATNLQGDVIAILNSLGSPVVEYTYDAWGNIVDITEHITSPLCNLNPLRYRGYVYDRETGLYYLQSRYYNPEMGRFISADSYASTGQGVLGYNMFAYCGNNPVSREDPSGDAFETVFDIVSLGFSIAEVAANPTDPWAWAGLAGDLIDVAVPFVTGVGEAAKAISFTAKAADAVDDAYDASKAVDMLGGICFVAGTLVCVEDGYEEIENIEADDYVWAWDEATGDVSLKRVVETYVNETNELVHVFVNGEEIISTPKHPFYSPVKGWTEAVQLRAGDILVLVNGDYVVVEKVQHEILEAPVTVYNFQVEDYHTYYVANYGVLVHNSCYKPIREGDFRAVVNPGEMEAPHAHIFQKANNIGRIFKDGKIDNSLKNNKDAMKFLKRKMDLIMELIDDYYGKR